MSTDVVELVREHDSGKYASPAHAVAALEGLCQELADEIERLRLLLSDARDDVAECYARETKPYRIIAYREQLAAIDRALGRDS